MNVLCQKESPPRWKCRKFKKWQEHRCNGSLGSSLTFSAIPSGHSYVAGSASLANPSIFLFLPAKVLFLCLAYKASSSATPVLCLPWQSELSSSSPSCPWHHDLVLQCSVGALLCGTNLTHKERPLRASPTLSYFLLAYFYLYLKSPHTA
jgi:hypothetical protein